MSIDELGSYFKYNQSEIARLLGIQRNAVHRWFKTGKIPLTRQFQLEVLTNGELKADRN
ncbi:Cro/CI family transcriptional regulator [Legionella pneumophila]|uniref:Cro/CI family transcriptional regulator n=1 Tax=Legionella pneumophila TaxID=446 RepID=UPI002AFAF693|nr:hypothetical protein [Legionella pneumophila]